MVIFKFFEKQNRSKAFTLVEIMVAVLLFFMLVAIHKSLLTSVITSQRKVLYSQELYDQLSYSMEYMSRSLRMAQKCDGVCCTSGNAYETVTEGIKFVNYKGICQEFSLVETGSPAIKQLKERRDDDDNGTLDDIGFLSSPNIDMKIFDIYGSGWDESSQKARVTLFLEAEGVRPEAAEFQSTIKIQTTLSRRNLND